MIQFIVIAKGSERVAEVAARFTLDAMPGKQMSIDAELRAGHIDHAEARRRRAALARESQLFGSMDGAMKFVKGDAVAGIVVLAVNIVGGLVIGVFQRGLDLSVAGAHVHRAHDRGGAGRADSGAGDLDGRRHHRHPRRVRGRRQSSGQGHRPADPGAPARAGDRRGSAGGAGRGPRACPRRRFWCSRRCWVRWPGRFRGRRWRRAASRPAGRSRLGGGAAGRPC